MKDRNLFFSVLTQKMKRECCTFCNEINKSLPPIFDVKYICNELTKYMNYEKLHKKSQRGKSFKC